MLTILSTVYRSVSISISIVYVTNRRCHCSEGKFGDWEAQPSVWTTDFLDMILLDDVITSVMRLAYDKGSKTAVFSVFPNWSFQFSCESPSCLKHPSLQGWQMTLQLLGEGFSDQVAVGQQGVTLWYDQMDLTILTLRLEDLIWHVYHTWIDLYSYTCLQLYNHDNDKEFAVSFVWFLSGAAKGCPSKLFGTKKILFFERNLRVFLGSPLAGGWHTHTHTHSCII